MLNFKFLNLAKPKKVFEKLNKMDRKQAYTVGAIIVVAVVALLMLVSSLDGEGDPMEGMTPRGYDLATMPFVNDEAEKMLLASYYPDMQENGSTLLYTSLEKEQRQKEDEEYELVPLEDNAQATGGEPSSGQEVSQGSGSSVGGSGSGRRGYTGSGAGRTPTEIGKLERGTMASMGGSGIGSFYGPSVDNRGLHAQTGTVAPAQLKAAEARKALQQFRAGSFQASRLRDNKNLNARKAMQGGNIQGSQAFGEKGIDVSKLGGLALDTSELPKTTDLGNLDDKVDNAVKDQQKKEEKEHKLGFWEQLGQDLLRQAASGLVDAVTTGVGDSIKGWINGNSASRTAGKQAWAEYQTKSWNEIPAADQAKILKADPNAATTWGTKDCKATYGNAGKYVSNIAAARQSAYAEKKAEAIGSTKSPTTNVGQSVCTDAIVNACGTKGAHIANGKCVCNS